MSVILLTVVGPDQRIDLAVPDDSPVEELMPTFVEMAAPGSGADPGGWALAAEGGAALPRERSLGHLGVGDGAVLHLTSVDPAPATAVPEAKELEPQATPGAGSAPPWPSAAPPDGREAGAPSGPDPLAAAAPEPLAALAKPPRIEPDRSARDPLERTRQALPRKISPFVRLGDAARAAVSPEEAQREDAPAEGDVLRPAAVTVARKSTPAERSREAWRRTDYRRLLDDSIVVPRLRQCATIAVVSPKGGVGKTTITALLGSLLAHIRRDRTVAIDTNPDYGSLGPTLAPDHDVFVDDLLGLLDRRLTITELDAHLGRGPDGLMVLPAPTDPQRMARLDRAAYVRVIEHLQERAGVLVLDCGTGLQEPAAQAAILTADQLVLVTDHEPSTATLVAQASKLLLRSGLPLTLVVNKMPRRGARLDLPELGRLVPTASAMAVVDSDSRAAARIAAGTFSWADEHGRWSIQLRELLSAMLDQWEGLDVSIPDGEEPGHGR